MESRFRITMYVDDEHYACRSMNEDGQLINQLFQYHKDLGVEAYQADTEDLQGTVRWELQGKWYDTSQIERIMKLRAFL